MLTLSVPNKIYIPDRTVIINLCENKFISMIARG